MARGAPSGVLDSLHVNPGLSPWAIIQRPFGAKRGEHGTAPVSAEPSALRTHRGLTRPAPVAKSLLPDLFLRGLHDGIDREAEVLQQILQRGRRAERMHPDDRA